MRSGRLYHRSGASARSLANSKARPEAADTFSYGIEDGADGRRLPRAARARREHRRRCAPDARDLRCRMALRGRHLGPAGSPADRVAVRPGRDRGAAVRADPARARRAQPLARALLPALEHHPDRAHDRRRGCRRRVDEPARAAVLHPGDLRCALVPARLGGRDRARSTTSPTWRWGSPGIARTPSTSASSRSAWDAPPCCAAGTPATRTAAARRSRACRARIPSPGASTAAASRSASSPS